MKLKVNTSKDAIGETGGGSSYMAKSGVYDVTINFANVAVSTNGAESVNFNLDYNGNQQAIYGPYVTDTQGNDLEIGMKLINKLAIIAGLGDGDEFEIEEETHAVGKDNLEQEFAVITNFSELPIKIRLQEEYTVNPKTNQIRKSMVIKNFFREDGASAEEIVNGTEIGKRLALETEKYSTNVTYKDGLTPEAIEAWKADKAAEGGKKTTPTPKAKSAATSGPKKKLFT